jgi:hypothetical protein
MARIDTEKMAAAIHEFKDAVNDTLEQVADDLVNNDYGSAVDRLNALTQRVASTSLGVRNVLIQGGHIVP